MAIGDALSKTFLYSDVEDAARVRTGILPNLGGLSQAERDRYSLFTPALFLKEIALSVLKVANILNGLSSRFYGTKIQTLTITGSANPYTVDLTSISPFPMKIIRVTHVTGAGVRSYASPLDAVEAETQIALLSTVNSSGLYYVDMGDSLELRVGSLFTVTIATDKIHLFYLRQPINASVTRASKVDVLDVFVPYLIQDVVNKFNGYKTGQPLDAAADQELQNNIKGQYQSIVVGKQLGVEERP